MHEPPVDLPDDTLDAGLRTHYGLAVTAVTFLPLGQDSSAWVYRVRTADDASYFLKVRTSVTNAPSLLVPRYLHDHGVAQVIAPLPTTTGALWTQVEGYALILYPFIAGTTGMAHGMAPPQWIAYGAILRQIHTTVVAPALAHLMRRETFVPAGAATVRAVEAHISGRTLADPAAQDLATLWHERWDTVHTLVARAEELGRQLARADTSPRAARSRRVGAPRRGAALTRGDRPWDRPGGSRPAGPSCGYPPSGRDAAPASAPRPWRARGRLRAPAPRRNAHPEPEDRAVPAAPASPGSYPRGRTGRTARP